MCPVTRLHAFQLHCVTPLTMIAMLLLKEFIICKFETRNFFLWNLELKLKENIEEEDKNHVPNSLS